MSDSNLRRLFDLPLGSWFRYVDTKPTDTYVFLGHEDCGLVGDSPDRCKPVRGARLLQGLYSAAESRREFEALIVEAVPLHEVQETLPAADVIAALRELVAVKQMREEVSRRKQRRECSPCRNPAEFKAVADLHLACKVRESRAWNVARAIVGRK